MRHWYWCVVTEGDEEPVKNRPRVEALLKAHGLGVCSQPAAGTGIYMVLLPEFPEHVEVVEIELGVGPLTVKML